MINYSMKYGVSETARLLDVDRDTYIKSITGEEINHNLHDLLLKLKVVLKNEFNASPPEWFENIIEAFHYSDPKGEAFRYGITVPKEELFADMRQVKTLMNWLSVSFKRIKVERLKTNY